MATVTLTDDAQLDFSDIDTCLTSGAGEQHAKS